MPRATASTFRAAKLYHSADAVRLPTNHFVTVPTASRDSSLQSRQPSFRHPHPNRVPDTVPEVQKVSSVSEESRRQTPGKPSTSVRYAFVDLLRGLALVVMVETHVVNAYLPGNLRGNTFFYWLAFLNGLVAPSFLFASGFSLVLQGRRHWDDWLRFRAPFWKHMRRLGFIVLVGYLLHIQHFRLSKYLASGDPDVWKRTLQVDILQCIVMSLMLVHILVLIAGTRRRLAYGAVVLGLGFVLLTPWMWAQNFTSLMPLALALFLNPGGASLFPIFPWAAFLLAGSCACCLFLSAVERDRVQEFMRLAAIAGAALICAGLLGRLVPFSLPGYRNFYLTSPLYVAIRLGCVLILLSVLWALERRGAWHPRGVLVAGQESLLAYGLHLVIIFGALRNRYVGRVLGLEAGYPGCFVLSVLVIILMLEAAQRWHVFKRQHPRLVFQTQAAAIITLAAVFLLS